MTELPRYAAMLAAAGPVPADLTDWAIEPKIDGCRAITYITDQGLRVQTRRGRDQTNAWPELAALAPAGVDLVLDGEIIVLRDGRASFSALTRRMHVRSRARAAALAAQLPCTLCIFDILHAGNALVDLPYTRRRRILETLELSGPHWFTVPLLTGPLSRALAHTAARAEEGVVLKRRDSRYLPGQRSPLWVKVKHRRRQLVVLVGFRHAAGTTDEIGALLLAVHNERGKLVYAGTVPVAGSATRKQLQQLLFPLRTSTPAVTAHTTRAAFVRPRLVGEVEMAEWTPTGRLRHPAWKGLRAIDPDEVYRL